MLDLVQVTAPVPPRAALRTVKFEAAPRSGAAAAHAGAAMPSSAAAASKHWVRLLWRWFMGLSFFFAGARGDRVRPPAEANFLHGP
jgi:hypothetical protein